MFVDIKAQMNVVTVNTPLNYNNSYKQLFMMQSSPKVVALYTHVISRKGCQGCLQTLALAWQGEQRREITN